MHFYPFKLLTKKQQFLNIALRIKLKDFQCMFRIIRKFVFIFYPHFIFSYVLKGIDYLFRFAWA